MNTIKQLKSELETIVISLEENAEGTNLQTLGFEALALIKEILEIESFDVDTRIFRMRINTNWVFDNSSEIIKDATYIIENDAFGEAKMVGYDWLTWVYSDVLAMPDKAVETIEEQLVETHSLFDKHYDKDRMEGNLLNKMGFIKYNTDQKESAVQLWQKSYDKYPYIDERNAVAGMLLLDEKKWKEANIFLQRHFEWCFQSEDGYRLHYGRKLKELYDNKELDEQPDLIALLFHVIRNEEHEFGLKNNLDYLNRYLPEAEQWAEKFPKNSMLWTAIGNTYFFDSKNYEKALFAYTKAIEGDDSTYTPLDRTLKSAKKMKVDLSTLPLKFTGSSGNLYNNMTDVPDGGKKKKKKLYAELACKYGESCYQQYRGYFFEKNGNTANNQPHLFAMSCNNYGLALKNYNKLFNKKKDRIKLAEYAANIHIEGYKMSPFLENLENGAQQFYEAKNYEKCIEYYNLYLDEYLGDIDLFDIQIAYWYILFSYAALDNYQKTEETYEKAKNIYLKTGAGVRNATMKFIFIAKGYYLVSIDDKKEFQKIIPELEWFLTQKSFIDIEPKEVGLMNYYLGICYKETRQSDKAIAVFQQSINQLEDEDVGYYYDKSQEAGAFIKELGGKPKGEKGKKKGLLGRFWK